MDDYMNRSSRDASTVLCVCVYFFLRAHLEQHVGEVTVRKLEVSLVVKF